MWAVTGRQAASGPPPSFLPRRYFDFRWLNAAPWLQFLFSPPEGAQTKEINKTKQAMLVKIFNFSI